MSAPRRCLLALAALALLISLGPAACKKQDPAIRVTIKPDPNNGFRIPADTDGLTLYVYDQASSRQLAGQSFPLAAGLAFPQSIVLVDSGDAQPTVRLACTLYKGSVKQGYGEATAQFVDGQTTDVTLTPVWAH
jgi:hypothetical protein